MERNIMNRIKIEAIFEVANEKVWEAITDPEIMKIWYFDIPNFNLNVGTKFSFYENEKKEYLHEAEVLQVEKNKLFQHTWAHPQQSKGSSIVTWEIDEVDGKAKLVLTQEGVDSFADAGLNFAVANYEMGWNAIIKTNLRNYLYNIEKLVFTQEISASSETIWNKMWNKNTYTDWTSPFCAGSYFTGEIELGNRIHFMSPSGEGMYSDVLYLDSNKIVVFKHIGMVKDLNEQPIDSEAEKWTGCLESYKLNQKNGVTTLTAEVDCVAEYINYMKEKFPLALQELKKIVENK